MARSWIRRRSRGTISRACCRCCRVSSAEPDGRLRVKGGQPTQAALQVSSASLIDPSTGDFDLELPAPSVESVEVLANPFAAEFGRFATSVTQIRTRRGTDEWEFKPGNLMPRFRKGFSGIRGFEPRFSVRGPIRRDRLFLAQDLQYRFVETPVKSLPDEPGVELTSFDSFTRLDTILSARHTLGGALIIFPRDISHATMNTFRPPETTPDLKQEGWSAGLLDRFALSPNVVLETTVAGRRFEIEVKPEGAEVLTIAPQSESGNYFNTQERHVRSFQWVESISLTRNWRGEHVIKTGADVQWARFEGSSENRPVEVRRIDGSLAERTVFGGPTQQEVAGTEVALFGQDRWRAGSRLTMELGFRMDRDPITRNYNWSPRAGAAVSVLPEGRAIIRGGYGKFVARTALNIEAFPQYESRVVTRFGPDGITALGPAVAFAMRSAAISGRRKPTSATWSGISDSADACWSSSDSCAASARTSTSSSPIPRRGSCSSRARAHRVIGSSRRRRDTSAAPGAISPCRTSGRAAPPTSITTISSTATSGIRSCAPTRTASRQPTCVTACSCAATSGCQGSGTLRRCWSFGPGFPYSAVDEFQDFVGTRNHAGRLPSVQTLDFQLSRPWRFRKYRFRAGLKVYNVFGSSADRDVQNNITVARLRHVVQPDRAIDWICLRIGQIARSCAPVGRECGCFSTAVLDGRLVSTAMDLAPSSQRPSLAH